MSIPKNIHHYALYGINIILLFICMFLSVISEKQGDLKCEVTFTASIKCEISGIVVKQNLTCYEGAASQCHVIKGLMWFASLSIIFSILTPLSIYFEEKIPNQNRKLIQIILASMAFLWSFLIPFLLICTLQEGTSLDVFPILLEFTAVLVSGAGLFFAIKGTKQRETLLG